MKNFNLEVQRVSSAGRSLVLCMVNPGSIPYIPYAPVNPPGMIPKHNWMWHPPKFNARIQNWVESFKGCHRGPRFDPWYMTFQAGPEHQLAP